MSLADLLNLGRKEKESTKKADAETSSKKEEEPKIEYEPYVPKKPKLDEKEAALLREQLVTQSKEMMAEDEKKRIEETKAQAGLKRLLEQSAVEAATLAKKQKEEATNLQQWHKTTLCKFFFQSRCDKGNFCPFAHSLESMLEATSSTKMSSRAKTKLCKHFEIGQCMNGDYCQYIHNVPEMPPGGWMGDSWMMGDGGFAGNWMGGAGEFGGEWYGYAPSTGSSGSGYTGSESATNFIADGS